MHFFLFSLLFQTFSLLFSTLLLLFYTFKFDIISTYRSVSWGNSHIGNDDIANWRSAHFHQCKYVKRDDVEIGTIRKNYRASYGPFFYNANQFYCFRYTKEREEEERGGGWGGGEKRRGLWEMQINFIILGRKEREEKKGVGAVGREEIEVTICYLYLAFFNLFFLPFFSFLFPLLFL